MISEMIQDYDELPRKVVLFHETLVNPGGAERLFVEEYKFLKRQGIQTNVITFDSYNQQALHGIAIPELEVLQRHNLLDGLLKLRKRLLVIKPDIVVTACGLRDLYLATRGTKLRYLLHLHEPPFKWFLEYKPILYSFMRRGAIKDIQNSSFYAFSDDLSLVKHIRNRSRTELESILDALAIRGARRITVLSSQAAMEVMGLYGREAMVVRGAISADSFTSGSFSDSEALRFSPDGKSIILSISRLDKEKRMDMIVRAFAKLVRNYPDVLLRIGGVGAEEKNLKKLARDLALEKQVLFLGYVPVETLRAYYQACDVFVVAQRADFNISLYEALALNRKVVCSVETEIEPEILSSGLVFQAKPTVEDYAATLYRALTSAEHIVPDLSNLTWENYFRCSLAYPEAVM
ncbi:glycosyltransferase family 4 protein [Thermodesulfobacteriota bacterium]